MAIHTSFAKKVIGSEDSDDSFLASLRNDSELYLPLLDVKDSVPNVALREDDLILLVFRYRRPLWREIFWN